MAGKIKWLIFQGSEMFINMINPHYPGPDMAAGTCQFRLFKNNPNVCQVRVDFVDTELLTPKNGNCVDQYMTITGTIWPTGTNRICGINPGKSKKIKLWRFLKNLFLDQHFYVHFNDVETFEHIDFQITTAQTSKPYKFGKFTFCYLNCS